MEEGEEKKKRYADSALRPRRAERQGQATEHFQNGGPLIVLGIKASEASWGDKAFDTVLSHGVEGVPRITKGTRPFVFAWWRSPQVEEVGSLLPHLPSRRCGLESSQCHH